jgi:sulfur-oxidizing protein SoxZ
MSTSIRIKAPKTARKGDVVELKALIQHKMESGYRRDEKGETIPRKILTEFICLYNQEEVFRADFHPGVSANPILTFYTRAIESGTLRFRWTEQTGDIFEDSTEIKVS